MRSDAEVFQDYNEAHLNMTATTAKLQEHYLQDHFPARAINLSERALDIYDQYTVRDDLIQNRAALLSKEQLFSPKRRKSTGAPSLLQNVRRTN